MIVQSLKCSAYFGRIGIAGGSRDRGRASQPPRQQSETEFYTITVEAACDRAILELDKFVYSIRRRGVRLEPATTRTHCEYSRRTSKSAAIQLDTAPSVSSSNASARLSRSTRADAWRRPNGCRVTASALASLQPVRPYSTADPYRSESRRLHSIDNSVHGRRS
jgi:hypothetical protein